MATDSLKELIDTYITQFDIHYKIARSLHKLFPPNEQEYEICNRLNVPCELWSMFIEKVISALNQDKTVFYPFFDNELEKSEYAINCYDFSKDFADMNLEECEKLFIVLHKVLKNRYNETCTKLVDKKRREIEKRERKQKEKEKKEWKEARDRYRRLLLKLH